MDLFGLDKTSKHPEGLELLTTVYDNVEFAIICSILDGAEIPYLIKERGSGSSVKIITGYSMFGTDIFVRHDDFEVASAIITPDGDGECDNDNDGDSDSKEIHGNEKNNATDDDPVENP